MDLSSFIQQIRNHIASGHRDVYTEPYLDLARRAFAERTASPGQQTQLATLIKALEALPLPDAPPGSSFGRQ